MNRAKRDYINRDVIIIGAGASGLFCAAECGKRGRSVVVLDHADRACSKVLISGGGRCNFTNLNITADRYLSSNPHFCRSALARFTAADILTLMKKHKIAWYEKEAGQLFCVSSSRDIAMMLTDECRRAKVEVRLKCGITDIRKDERFIVTAGCGIFCSDSLVVASGGLSFQNLGATGFGHAIARQFGLAVTGLGPGLVPFVLSTQDQKAFTNLAGISLDAVVTCRGRRFRGNVLFTHRGLSGPAVLQASLYWSGGTAVVVDLLPDTDIGAVFDAERRSRAEMKTLLSRYFSRRFADTWCGLYAPSKPLHQYSNRELHSIEERLHGWEIKPKGTEGYARAEVTVGGVDTRGISSKTMEAITTPGLYFIGEVLDVTGQLGGYNLHWAWASGHAAGQYA